MSRVRTPVSAWSGSAAGHELVLAGPLVRDRVGLREARLEVVGGQHRILADLHQAAAAVRPEVGIGAHEARQRCPGRHAPGRSRSAARPGARGGTSRRPRAPRAAPGRYGSSFSPTATGPGPGTAAAVRRGEGLVDVEVHHVEARRAGPELAQDRVQVGAVHVGQRAGGVDRLQQLHDARLEEAQGRRVGQHHGGRARAERGAQRVEVDATVGRRGHGRPW